MFRKGKSKGRAAGASGRTPVEVLSRARKRVSSTVKTTLAGVALVLAAYVGFRWGSYVFPPAERLLGLHAAPVFIPAEPDPQTSPEPTPALADSTLDRVERFRRGKAGDHLALSGVELSSVVRYSMPGLIPPGMSDPTVVLEQGHIRLEARVAVAAFPPLDRLQGIMGMLPDTVPMEMEGFLIPTDQEYMALLVDKVELAHFVLPKAMVAQLLKSMGQQTPPSMPPDALPVPIPDGVKTLYIQRDSLVLVAKR